MADVKISQLPAATTPVAGTEVLPIVQSGTTAQLSINGLTGITRPFTANGVMYASSATALATGSALTFDGTNFATTGSVTSAGASNSGNLAFTSTGNRITGDFTNATVASRVMFQTSTVNSASFIYAIPNGTSQIATLTVANSSSPDNSSWLDLSINASEARVRSSINGTGTYLPMTFYTSGSERVRIDTSGNVGIGTSSPSSGSAKLSVYSATGNNRVRSESAGTTGSDLGEFFAVGGSYFTYLQQQGNGNANIYGNSLAMLIGTSAAGVVTVYTSGSERMRIDSSGNVGIGTSSPSASAILDAQSTTKGVRMPNMTTTQKNAIASPAAGLMVFDTTLSKLAVYSGSAWQTVTSV